MLKCPICQHDVKDMGNSPNGGELFIAEDMDGDTECHDADITQLECTNPNCKFIFYANNA